MTLRAAQRRFEDFAAAGGASHCADAVWKGPVRTIVARPVRRHARCSPMKMMNNVMRAETPEPSERNGAAAAIRSRKRTAAPADIGGLAVSVLATALPEELLAACLTASGCFAL